MKYSALFIALLMIGFVAGGVGYGAEPALPVINGKKTVAIVNDEPITLQEFNQELRSLPEKKKEKQKRDFELLGRLINTRLMLQEARKIGLDELSETKNMVDVFSRVTLRELLMERQVKGLRADEKEVDRRYKETVKEWKISSVMVKKEDAAKKMEEEIRVGHSFEEVANRLIADGAAKGGEERNYLSRKDFLPQVADALSKMDLGAISPIISVQGGFVLLKLQDVRYPENQETKERVRQEALTAKKLEALKKFNDSLIKKYVKIHQDILDRIDYESKEPGVQELLKDKRIVAEVKGEEPITVGELTEYLRQQLYHGMDLAAESKRLNSKKNPTLDEMLFKRVFRKEALRLGIDKTQEYKNRVTNYERSVVFGAFVEKAVAPDVKTREEDLRNYYNEHILEFTYPEMIKIKSLTFEKREDAENAIEKLREGVDFQWLAANAEGQLNKNTKDLMHFEGNSLATKSLPEGVQKAVSGARSGDLRLYASPEGYFYVLSIQEVTASRPQPYAEARETVARIVYNEKLQKAVEDWADKLRVVSDIKIYLKDN